MIDTPVSTHSRLKAAGRVKSYPIKTETVSTHSRLKAAGICKHKKLVYVLCFNTQPPEGGWPFPRPPV